MAAADPSEVGQHCSLVRGSWTGLALRTWSRVYSSLNCDLLKRESMKKSSVQSQLERKDNLKKNYFLYIIMMPYCHGRLRAQARPVSLPYAADA